ncbi:MAG: nuclear transport factor 2 family protein [Prochloraceae cyanobacterium]|nr:nuclear transport factor 2 family protein [Prochloraceae cyanobacterium]
METTNQTEVLELNQAFYRAFEKRDINSMAKLWFQGAGSLCIHPGGKVLKGWNEVRLSWEQIFSHTDYIEIETEIVTKEIGERVAYIVAIENVLQVNGDRRFEGLSMATNIFEKMAQKWYLIHHHGSPIIR